MDDRTEARIKELRLSGSEWDWPEVFKYASGAGEGGTPFWVLPNSKPEQNGEPAASFDIADVDGVEASVEGENDGADWVVFGLLKDGRWFSVTAGCDYTGWG